MSILDKILAEDDSWIKDIYSEYHAAFIQHVRKKYRINEETAKELFKSALLDFYQEVRKRKIVVTEANQVQQYILARGSQKAEEYLEARDRKPALSIYEFSILYEEVSDLPTTSDNPILITLLPMFERLGQPCLPLMHFLYFDHLSWAEISRLLGFKDINSAKNTRLKCVDKVVQLAKQDNLRILH